MPSPNKSQVEERTETTANARTVSTGRIAAPLGMFITQIITTGMQILGRIILIRGTFVYAFVTYRSIIAAISVAPLALFFERDLLKKLRWSSLLWIFANATTGITFSIGFYYYGLRDTTATYSTCFLNMIPIATFFFSAILRIERLSLDTKVGRLKLSGALICVAGGMVVTLYKGEKLFSKTSSKHVIIKENREHHPVRGTLFLIACCISNAFWYIGQTKLYQIYPSKYWATTLTCAVGALQSMVVGLIIDQKRSAWKLGSDLQLLTIVYSGVLTTGFLFCITTWVATVRGPTYASMFASLTLVFVATLEPLLFVDQEITVGSLVGMMLIIGGLFTFFWGKERESLGTKETCTGASS